MGKVGELVQASKMFEPETSEVFAARRFVCLVLEGWGWSAEDVALLVSELATNAVLHARSEFTVRVSADSSRVRIEVYDRNSRMPQLTAVPADAYSGRGLMLVQALSDAWGVEAHPEDGKIIWFELASVPVAQQG